MTSESDAGAVFVFIGAEAHTADDEEIDAADAGEATLDGHELLRRGLAQERPLSAGAVGPVSPARSAAWSQATSRAIPAPR